MSKSDTDMLIKFINEIEDGPQEAVHCHPNYGKKHEPKHDCWCEPVDVDGDGPLWVHRDMN